MRPNPVIPAAENGVELEAKHYPSPLASHEEVAKNPSVFWNTLRIFHKTLGRKHM